MTVLQVTLQSKLKTLMKKDEWCEVTCPLCSKSQKTNKKTAGFVCNDSGGIGYNCFKCKTKISWAPPEKPKKKFIDLLLQFGFSEQELKGMDYNQ
jgi:hypothetical protein